nr:MAG TPA: hypothetical protein [Bacteriophage sp.]
MHVYGQSFLYLETRHLYPTIRLFRYYNQKLSVFYLVEVYHYLQLLVL